jgi:hypothetical protein
MLQADPHLRGGLGQADPVAAAAGQAAVGQGDRARARPRHLFDPPALGLSRNKTLDALAEPWREQCRWNWKPGLKVRRFHQFQYAAESWAREEKVIARVEATALGTDARFIVTSLTGRASISTRRSIVRAGPRT